MEDDQIDDKRGVTGDNSKYTSYVRVHLNIRINRTQRTASSDKQRDLQSTKDIVFS